MAACLVVWGIAPVGATAQRLVLDREVTQIRFRVGATLHAVEGSAILERGVIDLGLETGDASGEIVVDARSLETGNARRDGVMHAKVLESETFPTIVFVAERFEGSLAKEGVSRIDLHGELRIHGQAHPTLISAEVGVEGDRLEGSAGLSVPYVALGMKDPSKLLLRVAKEVEVEIRFVARLLD